MYVYVCNYVLCISISIATYALHSTPLPPVGLISPDVCRESEGGGSQPWLLTKLLRSSGLNPLVLILSRVNRSSLLLKRGGRDALPQLGEPYIYVWMYVCMCVYIYMHTYMCVYIYICVCVCCACAVRSCVRVVCMAFVVSVCWPEICSQAAVETLSLSSGSEVTAEPFLGKARIYINIYIYIYVCVCVSLCVCVYVYMNMYVYIYTYIHMYICIYICVYVRVGGGG